MLARSAEVVPQDGDDHAPGGEELGDRLQPSLEQVLAKRGHRLGPRDAEHDRCAQAAGHEQGARSEGDGREERDQHEVDHVDVDRFPVGRGEPGHEEEQAPHLHACSELHPAPSHEA